MFWSVGQPWSGGHPACFTFRLLRREYVGMFSFMECLFRVGCVVDVVDSKLLHVPLRQGGVRLLR